MYTLLTRSEKYPQRRDWQESPLLVKVWDAGALIWRRWITVSVIKQHRFIRQVNALEQTLASMDETTLAEWHTQVRTELRKEGLKPAYLAKAFALVREVSKRVLGLRHHDVQLRGAYVLVNGFLAEMNTGEGKTLTAALAATIVGMSGRQVHVVTVNDYLAARDLEEMRPIFDWFGLTSGVVLEDDTAEKRRLTYTSEITYCTGKTLTFDYLKDRIALDSRLNPLQMCLDYYSGSWQNTILLPGLQFAIVDEVDSVLIDEARTPLIISAQSRDQEQEQFLAQSLNLANKLHKERHFLFDEQHQIDLTLQGRTLLTTEGDRLGGVWKNQFRREEAVLQALTALHNFHKDEHYIVEDDKIMIVDEHTGRVMPDRSWERGLHQLMELKEGVAVTPPRVTLAKISFQLFFRRFLSLAGMTGTCQEVAKELSKVYLLKMVKIPPNKPSLRKQIAGKVFADSSQRWLGVVEEIKKRQAIGQPVLVGTRTIKAAESLAEYLRQHQLAYQILHARQNAEEASIVAKAGDIAKVTIATNMAGRGTDIKLAPGVEQLGGLHVILTELHDSARVDRQLIGRCARQGQQGSWQTLLSLDDELVSQQHPWCVGLLKACLNRSPNHIFYQWLARSYYRYTQWRMERFHRRLRAKMLKAEFSLRQSLSFTGKLE